MSGFTPTMCRAARALLGWSRQDLAEAACLSLPIVEAYESKSHACRWAIEQLLERAFEKAGIDVFKRDAWGGSGVRWLERQTIVGAADRLFSDGAG